jgi:hypothetical protein
MKRIGLIAVIVVGVIAVAGISAGTAIAVTGGFDRSGDQDAATGPAALTASTSDDPFERLAACAREHGVDDLVERAAAGELDLSELLGAAGAAEACEDEVQELGHLLQDPEAMKGLLTDTVSCLEREGVTLSALAEALTGDRNGDQLAEAARACAPDLG